jgi:hypothetical protein
MHDIVLMCHSSPEDDFVERGETGWYEMESNLYILNNRLECTKLITKVCTIYTAQV